MVLSASVKTPDKLSNKVMLYLIAHGICPSLDFNRLPGQKAGEPAQEPVGLRLDLLCWRESGP
jgi:hypothetical protein